MKKYIGCDLGGTNLRAAIVDVNNSAVLHQMKIPTLAREGHDAVMQHMADLVLETIRSANLKKEDIGGVGIGYRPRLCQRRNWLLCGELR